MKKFVAIFATVLTLCSCLVTSAFAVDYGGTDLPDVTPYIGEYNYAVMRKDYMGDYALFVGDSAYYDSAEQKIIVESVSESPMYLFYNGAWNLWTNSTYHYLLLDEYHWSNKEIPELSCDGSTCPANDDNSDGVCDDCGLMLRLISTPTSYPALPVVDSANQESVLIKDAVGYKYYVIYSTDAFTVSGVHSDIFRANMSRVVPYKVYTYENGDADWVLNNDSSGSSLMLGMADVVTLLQSSFDWIDSETGDLFFPVPLWMEVEQVTQGEMPEMTQAMGGTMKTLVVCGVGLMACLVVFALFGKRWLIFLR